MEIFFYINEYGKASIWMLSTLKFEGRLEIAGKPVRYIDMTAEDIIETFKN